MASAASIGVGCAPVLELEEYEFDREKPEPIELSCDGSPNVESDATRRLVLEGQETLGLNQNPKQFGSACVRDEARLNVCFRSAELTLSGQQDTVIREIVLPELEQGPTDVDVPSFTLTVEADATVFLHLDLTNLPSFEILDFRIQAENADVTLSATGPYVSLSILGSARFLKVRHDGELILDSSHPLGDYGADSIYTDLPVGEGPPNNGIELLTPPACD